MDTRLFEKDLLDLGGEDLGLDATMRVAVGKAATPTRNMVMTEFASYVSSKIATTYLKVSSNLADLANKATARNNLDVYSKSETYTRSEVLTKVATVENKLGGLTSVLTGYFNTADPSVYSKISGILSMTSALDDASPTGYAKRVKITHNYGSTNYIVLWDVQYIYPVTISIVRDINYFYAYIRQSDGMLNDGQVSLFFEMKSY